MSSLLYVGNSVNYSEENIMWSPGFQQKLIQT